MENVGRSGAVTASAIIALLGSVVMGLGGIVLLLSLAALRLPEAQQAMAQSPPQPVSPELMIGGMAAGALALMVWGVASAVAILRGWPWGRVSFLAFGGMLAVFGTINVFGTALVALVFSRAALPDPNVPRGLMVGMMGGMALASAVAAGLGIWWLVLFNRAAVKGYFAGLATSIPDAPPIPRRVLIVAWMMVASVVAVPFLLFGSSAMPAYFFGIELQGPVRFAFLLTQVGVVVAAGVGLLRRRLGAHALAVGVYLFGLVNLGALLVTPGGLRRMLPASLSGSGAELPQEVVELMFPALMIFSLALTLALVGLLWSARARYVRACLA